MAGLEEWSSPAARRKARRRGTEFGLRLAATFSACLAGTVRRLACGQPRSCRRADLLATHGCQAELLAPVSADELYTWLPISSPAARASSAPIWRKSSSAAATSRPRRRQPDHRQAPQSRSHSAASSSSKATWPTSPFAHARRRRHGLRAAPGGDSVGAALGQGSDHLEPRQHRRDAERARRRARRRRQAAGLRGLLVGVRQHADAARSAKTCRRTRCRPTRCRRCIGDAVPARCSRGSTASRRWRSATSTCSGRGRIRRRRTPASSRSSRPRSSKGAQPTIYGDGEQTRDFTYVANVVDGVLRACEAPSAAGEVINVAMRHPHLAQRAAARHEPHRRHQPQPIYKDERAGDVKDSQADIARPRRCSATRRSSTSRKGCATRWRGAAPKEPPARPDKPTIAPR